MDTGVNSCKQTPTWSSEHHPPLPLPPLARARLHFLCLHAKVFRTAINSVLVWVGSPAGLAQPFIILGAWNCKGPSQVVGINMGWPQLFVFHQVRGDTVVWRLCHPSVCQALGFFHAGVGRKGNVVSYGSFVIW